MDIADIRGHFPALGNYTWFQNGGVSITPQVVADEHARLMRELFERGPMHIVYPDEEYPRRERSMQTLARFFSVNPDEIALMRGVSEAFQTVVCGMTWEAGDEILLSVDEEAALLLPALHLRDRFGVRIVKLPVTSDVLSDFRQRVSSKTRLIALSHVTTDLGVRLPIEAMCRESRDRGVPTFVDLAHSAGLFPIGLHDLGCDFAGALSYKWTYAPYAAGLLFVRRESLGQLAVNFAGGRSEKHLDFETDTYELRDTAERFQYGPWSWPLVHAWAKAVNWLEGIGLPNIDERTAALTTRLKTGLSLCPAVTHFTPSAASDSAALVSFGLRGWAGEQLAETLRSQWNMIVKPLPHSREGLRISVPFFTTEEEIDRLIDAIHQLAESRDP